MRMKKTAMSKVHKVALWLWGTAVVLLSVYLALDELAHHYDMFEGLGWVLLAMLWIWFAAMAVVTTLLVWAAAKTLVQRKRIEVAALLIHLCVPALMAFVCVHFPCAHVADHRPARAE